ncbi:heme exporter protein CcmD [Variovorax sp. YR216]|nr:heme exporter protein CcmD [Variovorax sp. YR216]SEA53372.1 Heme exporter protein D (CcmD) [Variovorax sp. YR216]
MDWFSQLLSGGHTSYVGAAFGITAVLIAVELVALRLRFKAARVDRP